MNNILDKSSCKIHFVGIGGIGMSGVAEIMHNQGYVIQGSDIKDNTNILRLKEAGIKIAIGHDEANIHNVDYLVISSAINLDNVEVQYAISQSIPIIKRAEMLAELMRFKETSIAVSGSHGKTTTTALIASLLEAAGKNPTVINGGIINNRSTNAYIGNSQYIVAEADESDGSFIKLPASIAVITNIDPEHMDHYNSFDNLMDTFKNFITNLPFDGFAVMCMDNENARKIANNIIERKIITYGIEEDDANIKAFNIRKDNFSSIFDVEIRLPRKAPFFIHDIEISIPGKHNILNALSSIAIGANLEFPIKVIKNAFKDFQGVKRRFTRISEYNGAQIIDDYAHHPNEILATLEAAKNIATKSQGKIYAIYQPHRYTRLQNLFEEFTDCFKEADELYIMDVFEAGEQAIPGSESSDLINAIKYLQAKPLNNIDEMLEVAKKLSPNDILLFMGAGTITNLAHQLAEKLQAEKILS